MDIETAFAKASMDNVTRRDPAKVYNKRTLAELKAAVPDFRWDEYLKLMGAPSAEFYIVTAPTFLPALEQQIQTRSLDELRTYLRWWVVHFAARRLGEEFVQADFDFFSTVLTGTPQMLPLWRRCVASADYYLGQGPLGEEYVKLAFGQDAKRRADELVSRIRASLKDELEHNDWMSEATKKQAVIKEEATLQKIG
jgi:predicted metalloendopeptidase